MANFEDDFEVCVNIQIFLDLKYFVLKLSLSIVMYSFSLFIALKTPYPLGLGLLPKSLLCTRQCSPVWCDERYCDRTC